MKANKLNIRKKVFYKDKPKPGWYVGIYANSTLLKEYGAYSKKEFAEGVARLLN